MKPKGIVKQVSVTKELVTIEFEDGSNVDLPKNRFNNIPKKGDKLYFRTKSKKATEIILERTVNGRLIKIAGVTNKD